MRSSARIPYVMERIQELWEKAPDMRFFQLMSLIEHRAKEKYEILDVFYLEEDKLLEVLKGIEEEWK